MAGEFARAKAKRLRSTAEHWDRGAEAEEATATALMALPPSWTVMQDPTWPGGRFESIDHVVVGPQGVFVIDTKGWSGQVTVQDGVLLQNGHDASPAVWAAAAAATSLAGLVPSVRPEHVHAVVSLADGSIEMAWLDGVLVCPSSQLVGELIGQAEVLPGGLVRAVAVDVGLRLRPGDHSAPSQFAAEQLRSARPGRKRRPFALLVLGVLAVAAAVVMLSQPDAPWSLVEDISDWFADIGS